MVKLNIIYPIYISKDIKDNEISIYQKLLKKKIDDSIEEAKKKI